MDLSTRKKNIFCFGWYAIVTLEFELARRNVELANTGQLWFDTYHVHHVANAYQSRWGKPAKNKSVF
jgi:hypothetical protein